MKKWINETKEVFNAEQWKVVKRTALTIVSFGIFMFGIELPYSMITDIMTWVGLAGISIFGGMVFLKCMYVLQGIDGDHDLDE